MPFEPKVVSSLQIALAFDARYAVPAQVLIESVLAEHSARVNFWLVAAGDVDRRIKERITRRVGGRATVTFLDPDAKLAELPPSRLPRASYLSGAMYLRLALPDLMPPEVERLIYLDCDTICVGSLLPLIDHDLAGAPLAAVRDSVTRRLVDMGGLPGLARYPHLDAQAIYFNSGVLVMDMPAWREKKVSERALGYIERHARELRYPDQDALNYAAYGDWLRLPARWNHMMPWRLESAAGAKLTDARIIHSTGPLKHWRRDYPDGDLKRLYAAYLSSLED